MTATTAARRARDEIVRLAHRGLRVDDFALGPRRFSGGSFRAKAPASSPLTPRRCCLPPRWSTTGCPRPPDPGWRRSSLQGRRQYLHHARSSGQPRCQLERSHRGRPRRQCSPPRAQTAERLGDELRAVLWAQPGPGELSLCSRGKPSVLHDAEVRTIEAVAASLAEGLRQTALLQALDDRGGGDVDAGLVVLTPDHSIEAADPAGARWLDELGPSDHLPVVIRSVAVRARQVADGVTTDPALACLGTGAGRWLLARGSVLGQGPDARVGWCSKRPVRPRRVTARIRLRLHRTRASRRRVRRPRSFHCGDRDADARLRIHRSGSPQVGVREVRYGYSRRTCGPPVRRSTLVGPWRSKRHACMIFTTWA